jgi:integrase
MMRGTCTIVATVDYIANYGYVETAPKTKAGKRTICLPMFLIDMLSQHKTKQEAQRQKVGDGWENKDLVFPDLHGGYFKPQYLHHLFTQILNAAGLPPMHFHDLRHSAATILLSLGVNMKVIQETLGHSNVYITLNTYSHLLPSMQQGVANTMNDAFGGK